MRILLLIIVTFSLSSSMAQLKLKSNLRGNYKGEIERSLLVQNGNSDQNVYLESTSACLSLDKKFFQLTIGEEEMKGSVEVNEKQRKSYVVSFYSGNYGVFKATIDKKRKWIYFNSNEKIPKFILKKGTKKEKCN